MILIADPMESKDFSFTIQNEEIFADVFKFGCYSKKFQSDISLIESKTYKVESEVDIVSFTEFLSACQGQIFSLRKENVLDFLLLCKEFNTPAIEREVESYLDKNEKMMIVRRLLFCYKKKIDYSELINKISSNLSNYFEDSDFLDLPDELICEIMASEKRNINNEHELLSFAERYTKKNKIRSNIYSYIDLQKLTLEEVLAFSKNKSLPKLYDTSKVFPLLSQLITKIKEQDKKIDQMTLQQQNLQNSVDSEIAKIKTQISFLSTQKGQSEDAISQINFENREIYKKIEDFCNEFEKINEKIAEEDNKVRPLEISIEALQIAAENARACKNPFKGIFHNMKIECKENPILAGKVIFQNSQLNYDFKKAMHPSHLLEYDSDSINMCYYHNLDKKEENEDNFIEFDFRENNGISVSAVSIRTNVFGEEFAHPKKFKIIGSEDHYNWVDIITEDDAKELNGVKKEHTFFVKENLDTKKIYRYIKYVQMDTHDQYADRFGIISLSAIEFFGKYKGSD